jgi:hypothetical protein
MAGYSNSGLSCIAQGVSGGPSLYVYSSVDAHGTVEGAGYFSDGVTFGMKVGDIVIVVDSDTSGNTTIHSVASVSGTAATINAAVLS